MEHNYSRLALNTTSNNTTQREQSSDCGWSQV